MEKIKNGNKCYNCDQNISLNHKYCPNCGQANHPTRLTIGVLVKDFIDNFFNLDSKFFQTLRYIYSPTFLTKEYLAGKRIRYANPIRLFIISLVILFALLALYFTSVMHLEDMKGGKVSIYTELERVEILEEFDRYTDTTFTDKTESIVIDSIRSNVFENVKDRDSTFLKMPNFNIGSTNLRDFNILSIDAAELSYDSIFIKYNITDFWSKIILKQSLKAYKNPPETIRFGISNSFWIIILTILFTSAILKILYIRHKMYFIEHVILQCNMHSLYFIIAIIAIASAMYFGNEKILFPSLFLLFFILGLFIFFRYYQQGFFKTIIKYFIYLFSYFMIMMFCAIFVIFASFLVF